MSIYFNPNNGVLRSSTLLKEARKVLGEDGKHLSDKERIEMIETAVLLKDVFFDMLKNKKLDSLTH